MLIFVVGIGVSDQFANSSAQAGFPDLRRQRQICDRGAAVGLCRLDAAARALHRRGAKRRRASRRQQQRIVEVSGQVTPVCDRNWKLAASPCKIGSDPALLESYWQGLRKIEVRPNLSAPSALATSSPP